MNQTEKATHFSYKDDSGVTYLCPIDAVKNRDNISSQEFEECVEEDVVRRYSGNVKVVQT